MDAERSQHRRRSWGARLLAVLVGIVATFVLLEGGLWTASLFFKPPDRAKLLAPAAGERRIVCIGDSNTYGMYLKPEESYPAQLEHFLSLAPGNPWRVVNLGFPGQNSAQVRGRLAENLDLYRAEILICFVGVNNCWSPAMSHLWQFPDREPEPPFFTALFQKCRTIGLARMALLRLEHVLRPSRMQLEGTRVVPGLAGALRGEGAGTVEPPDSSKVHFAPPDEVRRGLRIDLARLRSICSEHGAKLVLVTYPIEYPFVLRDVNPCIREFAEESRTPLVDLEESFLPLLPKLGRELLQFPDGHATAVGNYEVARLVLQALASAGLVESRAEWAAIAPVERTYRGVDLRVRGREERDVELDLEGEPHAAFQLSLGARLVDAAGADLPVESRPLRNEGLSDAERLAYFGKLDERGEAHRRIRLPELVGTDAPKLEIGVQRIGWRITARFVPPPMDVGRTQETRSVDVPAPPGSDR